MKDIIFAPNGFYSPESELLCTISHKMILEKDVDIYNCAGGFSCPSNPFALNAICALCKNKQNQYFEEMNSKNSNYKISRKFIYPVNSNNNVKSIKEGDDIRSIEHRGADSGYATLSTYIALTRDFEPNIKDTFTLGFLNGLMSTYTQHFDFFDHILKTEEVDRIHLWNGRMNTTRAVLRAAQSNSVDAICHESAGRDDRFTFFENVLPHNIKYKQSQVEKIYLSFTHEAEDIARQYYTSKMRGEAINDVSYVGAQNTGELPAGWSSDAKKIVFFSSSEDEYKSISKEWESGLFNDQLKAIMALCELSDDDAKVFVRVHPNVRGASLKYKKQIMELSHPKLTLIGPESKISTYALLDDADCIVTYGSTIGLEASYWGKPSLLIGASFYMGMGGVYEPNSLEDLKALLRADDLEPKSRLTAVKMAVFFTKNGYRIDAVKGSADQGYLLNGKNISLSKVHKFFYYILKIYEKFVMRFFLK